MNLLHLEIIALNLIHPGRVALIVTVVYLVERYFPKRILVQNSTTAIPNERPGICRCHLLSHRVLRLHCSTETKAITWWQLASFPGFLAREREYVTDVIVRVPERGSLGTRLGGTQPLHFSRRKMLNHPGASLSE